MAAVRGSEAVTLPADPPSGPERLQQLNQVPLGILERRDAQIPVIRGVFHELDARILQSLPVRPDIVGREGDHVARRIRIAAVHLAVGAEGKGGRPQVAEHDEPRVLESHLEAEDIAVERQQPLYVFAPDAGASQSLDHLGTSRFRRVTQPLIVFRMLPKCSSMWPRSARLITSSALIGGTPANTVPLLASSASDSPRSTSAVAVRSEEHTSELQSLRHLVCRLLLE